MSQLPKRIVAMLCLLLMCALNLRAQRSAEVNSHIIIAFDAALPDNERAALSNKGNVVAAINRAINENVPGAPLGENDFVSLLHFGIGSQNRSLDDLAMPVIDDNDRKLTWRPFDGARIFRFRDWMDAVYYQGENNFRGSHFSMLTSAKPFSLKRLKSRDDDLVANQTYLILVTDEHYNGLDNFEKEFTGLSDSGSPLKRDEFYGECVGVNNIYTFNRLKEYPLGASLKAIMFEVVFASVPSIGILDFPANYNMHREKDGMTFDFDVKAFDDEFTLEGFELDVTLADGEVITTRADEDGHIYLQVPYGDLDKDNIVVTSRAWLRPWDGKYNGVVLSPYATSPNAHAQRLTSTKTLRYDEEFKVFGMDMPDWLWLYPEDNGAAAALLLEVIAVLLIVIFIVLTIYAYNKLTMKYIPDNSEIHLHQIGKK